MKPIRYLKCLSLAILITPGMALAQNYNNIYNFSQLYQNSVHTCGIQVNNGTVIEGGTIGDGFTIVQNVELGIVNAVSGVMAAGPRQYSSPGSNHQAVDLIESSAQRNWVIVTSQLFDLTTPQASIGIFKTNPVTGVIAWQIKVSNEFADFYPKAITKDGQGNYFIVGDILQSGKCRRDMFVMSVSETGVVNWQRWIYTPVTTDDIESVDIIHDNSYLVVVANYYDIPNCPSPVTTDGLLVGRVRTNGTVLPFRHVLSVGNTTDLNARDMELVNGRYVIVGELDIYSPAIPARGFLLQYLPGLIPYTVFSQVYTPVTGELIMTGVKPSTTSNIHVSFDYRTPGSIIPGMSELTYTGAPIAPFTYNVNNYIASRGLISTVNNSAHIVKGATSATPVSAVPSLSLVSSTSPLFGHAFHCSLPLQIDTISIAAETDILMRNTYFVNYEPLNLDLLPLSGNTYDCMGMNIGSFKLAPTGIEENGGDPSVMVYPNPNNGIFTIEMDAFAADVYQVAEIYNPLGEVVKVITISNSTERIDLGKQAPGIYFLRMKSTDGNVSKTARILVK